MRVLLVDDEEELVTTLSERLSYRGIVADWATSAEAALERVQETAYDIAVLDVKLPRMSGLELKCRMEQIRPGMKYLFLTGHGSEEDFRAGAAAAGAVFYLAKPVNLDVLIGKMNELLKARESES
ncbi:MAG: response regulator [Planctomycetota bacterium]